MRSVIVLVFSVLMVSCLYTPKEKPVAPEKETVAAETQLFKPAKYNRGDQVVYIDYKNQVAQESYFRKAVCPNVGTVFNQHSPDEYSIILICKLADNKEDEVYISLPETYIVSKINQ